MNHIIRIMYEKPGKYEGTRISKFHYFGKDRKLLNPDSFTNEVVPGLADEFSFKSVDEAKEELENHYEEIEFLSLLSDDGDEIAAEIVSYESENKFLQTTACTKCRKCGKLISVLNKYKGEDGYTYKEENLDARFVDKWGGSRNFCKRCMG